MTNTHRELIKKSITCVVLFFCVFLSNQAVGQINFMGSAYYQNQYLLNPAMAGADDGLNINLAYRKQWSSFPGAPSSQYISGDYRFADKAAAGLFIYNEKTGLLQSTRVMGTYAYHLPLSDTRKIHMGLSLGILSERIDTDALNGDIDDPGVARFNDQGVRFNGDFGAGYTDGKLNVQAVLPNMMNFFDEEQKDVVNQPIFFVAASYQLSLNGEGDIALEPKVCFRGVKGMDNIIDAGANLTFVDKNLNFFAMYHSTKSITLGVGVKIKDMFTITGMYATPPAAVRSGANGNLEAGIRAVLWQNKTQQ